MADYQTVKDRLVFYIKYMDIAKSAFEKSIGASNGYINSIKKSIGQQYLDQISNIYTDLDISWLLTGKGEMLKSEQPKEENSLNVNKKESTSRIETRPRIPLNAAAGSVGVAMNGVTENDTEQLPIIHAFSNYNYTILVKGDSMLPEFHSGDEIACLILKGGTSFIQWGRYHVLDTAQGVVVKRIYDNGEYILCKSENSNLYPDFNIHKEEIYNIGLVIGVLRRY